MAPGHKHVAKGVTMSELSLGDLVLAKVKGFPPWPAKGAVLEHYIKAILGSNDFFESISVHKLSFRIDSYPKKIAETERAHQHQQVNLMPGSSSYHELVPQPQ